MQLDVGYIYDEPGQCLFMNVLHFYTFLIILMYIHVKVTSLYNSLCRSCHTEEMAPPQWPWRLRSQRLPESQHSCCRNWWCATGTIYWCDTENRQSTQETSSPPLFFSFPFFSYHLLSPPVQPDKKEHNEDKDDIETNLLVPAGVTMRWATLSIKVYRAEDMPQSEWHIIQKSLWHLRPDVVRSTQSHFLLQWTTPLLRTWNRSSKEMETKRTWWIHMWNWVSLERRYLVLGEWKKIPHQYSVN